MRITTSDENSHMSRWNYTRNLLLNKNKEGLEFETLPFYLGKISHFPDFRNLSCVYYQTSPIKYIIIILSYKTYGFNCNNISISGWIICFSTADTAAWLGEKNNVSLGWT